MLATRRRVFFEELEDPLALPFVDERWATKGVTCDRCHRAVIKYILKYFSWRFFLEVLTQVGAGKARDELLVGHYGRRRSLLTPKRLERNIRHVGGLVTGMWMLHDCLSDWIKLDNYCNWKSDLGSVLLGRLCCNKF